MLTWKGESSLGLNPSQTLSNSVENQLEELSSPETENYMIIQYQVLILKTYRLSRLYFYI